MKKEQVEEYMEELEGNEIKEEPTEEGAPQEVTKPYDNQDEEAITATNKELNWREAGKKLKTEFDKNKNSFTIDTYFIKIKIDGLRERYNNKERSTSLHAEIMALK